MVVARLFSLILLACGLCAAPLRAEPISLVGTGDGLELFRALAAAYAQGHPGREVVVPPSIGSGGAIAAVGTGRARMGRIARPLSTLEAASRVVAMPVFELPAVFYLHPGVPLRSLSARDLGGILEGRITNWSQLGGPDLRIRVVRREEGDSTLTALRAGVPGLAGITLTERSKLALTTQEALDCVAQNEGAIGFAPYAPASAAKLGVVEIEGVVPVSPAYPARVRLSLIRPEGVSDDGVEEFFAFMRSAPARGLIIAAGAQPVAP